ncbi:MAG: radical SAM protein, partial [Spirochaetales bacterium]|nr:radical SAM protein [Spirochaetales bacterium]
MPGTLNKRKHFSLLVKPTSADCNLRCSYCFYLGHSALYPESRRHRMSGEVLERMIESYMQTEQDTYTFGWQGGEPTLMGVEFFKRAVELQKRYARPGAVVSNGLQTNATLIDDDLAAHLSEYNYLVGVSIDGPAELHDVYRKNTAGEGSHASVMKGIDALNRHKVPYNALVLVSSANVAYPEKVYNYLKSIGIYYHQYIPCVEFDGNGNPLPYTITGEQWGVFLNGLFDCWIGNDTRVVSIRDFDSILHHLVHGGYTMCVQGGCCD